MKKVVNKVGPGVVAVELLKVRMPLRLLHGTSFLLLFWLLFYSLMLF